MNKNPFLSGTAAAAVLCALDASAQFNYQNGDLLAAFGNGGDARLAVPATPERVFFALRRARKESPAEHGVLRP